MASCERFTSGLRHWVYDVVLDSGRNIVVRLSHPDNRSELAGGVFWHDQLRQVGVPVAALLTHDATADQPYMILERLDGTDLGNVFDELTFEQLHGVADSVSDMQRRARELPRADGFGYALNYGAALEASWYAVLAAAVGRSTEAIDRVGVVDPRFGHMVRNRLETSKTLIADAAPIPFLHDATTKNVIVADGHVTGLVDVDEMAFGDPLWATALTNMSLLSARRPVAYIDALMTAHPDQKAVIERLHLYTAIFCLGFLAELGHPHNQTTAPPIDPNHQHHLVSTLTSLLS